MLFGKKGKANIDDEKIFQNILTPKSDIKATEEEMELLTNLKKTSTINKPLISSIIAFIIAICLNAGIYIGHSSSIESINLTSELQASVDYKYMKSSYLLFNALIYDIDNYLYFSSVPETESIANELKAEIVDEITKLKQIIGNIKNPEEAKQRIIVNLSTPDIPNSETLQQTLKMFNNTDLLSLLAGIDISDLNNPNKDKLILLNIIKNSEEEQLMLIKEKGAFDNAKNIYMNLDTIFRDVDKKYMQDFYSRQSFLKINRYNLNPKHITLVGSIKNTNEDKLVLLNNLGKRIKLEENVVNVENTSITQENNKLNFTLKITINNEN